MVIGTTLFVVAILIIAIWVIIEVKRFKHKIFAMLLIALILFTYISFISVIKGNEFDFKSVEGVRDAGGLYFSWLSSVFGNIKTITVNAIHMDWKANETISEGG